MKNLSLFSLLVMIGLVLLIGGCQWDEMDDTALTTEKDNFLSLRNSSIFKDSSQWEYLVLQDILKKNDLGISNFINYYGAPSYNLAFQKRSDDIKITSIPTLKNGNITGVFKLYHTNEDSIRLEYFSVDELNSILNTNLDTKNYHVYRGAIQSIVIAQSLAKLVITNEYLNWLTNTQNRIEERVKFHCIEAWDCSGVYTSDATGWSFSGTDFASAIGFNITNHNGCVLLWRECWIDWSPRDFTNNTFGGGPIINWNNFFTGATGAGKTNEYIEKLQEAERERKKKELEACVNAQSDAATEAMLNEALSDIVFPCENFITSRLKKEAIKKEIKQKWCEEQSDNPGALQPDGSHIKPKMTEDDIDKALDAALEEVDYIIDDVDPTTCPQVSCILSKLFNYSFGPDDSPGFPFLDCDATGYTFNTGPISGDGVANWTTKTITINENLCNNNADPINIAETILHESMHLALWAVQTKLNNGDPNIDPNLLNAVNNLNNNFGGDHHEYLAAYLEGIANTLWNLNGKIGSAEDYYGLIWNGLSAGAGVDPKTNQAYSLYITQVMNTPGYNPNNYNYTDWINSQLSRYHTIIKPFNNLKFDCP